MGADSTNPEAVTRHRPEQADRWRARREITVRCAVVRAHADGSNGPRRNISGDGRGRPRPERRGGTQIWHFS